MTLDIGLDTTAVPISYYAIAVILSAIVVSKWKSSDPTIGVADIVSQISYSLRAFVGGWMFLFSGPGLIKEAYTKAAGKPFEIFAPDNRYVFVSSPEQVKEIDSASPELLSLFTATKQMLQPKYTMHGFNWPNIRGSEGIGFVRALRTMLTNHLPNVVPSLTTLLGTELHRLIAESETVGSGKKVNLHKTISRLVTLSHAQAFFGEELAQDEQFLQSAARTAEDTFMYAEMIRILPKFAQSYAGKLVLKLSSAQATVYSALIPIVQIRLEERAQGEISEKQDVISWIINTGPKTWTAHRIVYELLAIWFGASHGVSIVTTFGMKDLCERPEYFEPLRKELESDAWTEFQTTGQGLPLLDSFIKESTRLSPVECMSGRRQALQPFKFSDGTEVQKGEWVCTPAGAIMQDKSWYPDPDQFHGFRFVKREVLDSLAQKGVTQDKASKLTDNDENWHIWGIGRIICPGRFYAVAVTKIIMAQMIRNYDLTLLRDSSSNYFTWRSSTIPTSGTKVLFQART